MTPTSPESSLRRELGVFLGMAVVVNATIGTGIFKVPAKVARLSGSVGAALAMWGVGALIALAGALSLAETSAAIPRTGGLYEHLRRAYGPRTAFLLAWTRMVLLLPAAVGSFARLAAESLQSLRGASPDRGAETLLAVSVIAACAAFNLTGVRTSARQQAAVTTAKFLGVASLGAMGLLCALPPGGVVVAAPTPPMPFAHEVTAAGCFGALVSIMWAYDGWADLSSLSGEVRDPGRSLPRALVAGTAGIAAVYLLANLGYARVLGLEGLRRATTGDHMAASILAQAALGAPGRVALSALVLVSCVGACLNSLLTGPRVFVPIAADGEFPRALGAVSPRTGTPTTAVIASAALGVVYVSFKSFEQLTDAFVLGMAPFYALGVGAVIVLRRREPALPRPFRVPGYPVVPLVFLGGMAALVWGAAQSADRTLWQALSIVLLGLPVRAWFVRAAQRA
ncbi:MAG: amino acid permease [Polyangiales bacterium]